MLLWDTVHCSCATASLSSHPFFFFFFHCVLIYEIQGTVLKKNKQAHSYEKVLTSSPPFFLYFENFFYNPFSPTLFKCVVVVPLCRPGFFFFFFFSLFQIRSIRKHHRRWQSVNVTHLALRDTVYIRFKLKSIALLHRLINNNVWHHNNNHRPTSRGLEIKLRYDVIPNEIAS